MAETKLVKEVVTITLDLKLLERQLDNAGEMGCVSVSEAMRLIRSVIKPRKLEPYCPSCAGSLEALGISGRGTIYRCRACHSRFTF